MLLRRSCKLTRLPRAPGCPARFTAAAPKPGGRAAATSRSSALEQPPQPAPQPSAAPLAVEIWDRLEVCKACEHARNVVKGYPTLCASCGCLIQAKAMFPSLHCPLSKW